MGFTSTTLPGTTEDALRDEFFRTSPPGFFVDVGANHPQTGSQTWTLEQRGWSGVLIEPQPELADELRRQRRAKVYPVVCSSPSSAGKTMRLHLAGVYSSLSPTFYAAGIQRHGTIDVPAMTLDQILTDAQAPAPVDFVSIDVEGHEMDVLDGFDLARWQPRLILIEDEVKSRRVHNHLRASNYKWIGRTGFNAWYVPSDHPITVGLFGKLEFLRKYYLGVPFRLARDAKRRLFLR